MGWPMSFIFKPGARPQPPIGRLWAHAWFIKRRSVPIYLSLSVRIDPREQTIQVAKAALIQGIRLNKACNLLAYR